MPRLLPYRCPHCGDQLLLWDARTGETACPNCTRFIPAAPAPARSPDRRGRPAARKPGRRRPAAA